MSEIPDLMKAPVTRDEFRMLFERLSYLKMYIPEKAYYEQIGIGRTHFYNLRNKGKFDKGYHPDTPRNYRKRRFIHRFFNMHSGQIEIPGLNCTKPIEPMQKPRKPRKKTKKITKKMSMMYEKYERFKQRAKSSHRPLSVYERLKQRAKSSHRPLPILKRIKKMGGSKSKKRAAKMEERVKKMKSDGKVNIEYI